MERYGIENPQDVIKVGTCTADYAKKYDSFTLLTELPYFYDKRINDLSPGTMTRKEAVIKSLEFDEEHTKFIVETLDSVKEYLDKNNPFRLALEAFTNNKNSNQATLKMIENNPDFERTATVAEEFDNLLITRFYKMLSYGLLVQCANAEINPL